MYKHSQTSRSALLAAIVNGVLAGTGHAFTVTVSMAIMFNCSAAVWHYIVVRSEEGAGVSTDIRVLL